MSTTDTERHERLRGAREIASNVREETRGDENLMDDIAIAMLDLDAEVTRLDAVVTAVREVHQPEQVDCVTMACALGDCTDVHPDVDDCPTTTITVCVECDRIAKEVHASWDDTDVLQIAVPYPCPTVRALDGGAR